MFNFKRKTIIKIDNMGRVKARGDITEQFAGLGVLILCLTDTYGERLVDATIEYTKSRRDKKKAKTQRKPKKEN